MRRSSDVILITAAKEVEMGASRTTARRYLEYLVGTGELSAEVAYGSVGRPERQYLPKA